MLNTKRWMSKLGMVAGAGIAVAVARTAKLPKAGNCPPGSAPNLRVTQEQLARFASVKDFFAKYPKFDEMSETPEDESEDQSRGSIIACGHTVPTDRHQYARAENVRAIMEAMRRSTYGNQQQNLTVNFSYAAYMKNSNILAFSSCIHR